MYEVYHRSNHTGWETVISEHVTEEEAERVARLMPSDPPEEIYWWRKKDKIMRAREIDGHVKMMKGLNEYIENLIAENNYLKETIKGLKTEEGIKRVQEELDHMRSRTVHTLTDKEYISLHEFREKHYTSCKSGVSIAVTPTGIGDSVSVRCSKCKVIESITDIDHW